MPLRQGFDRNNYFNDAFFEVVSPTVETYLKGATIRVFVPSTGTATFNVETGKYEYSTPVVDIYNGTARVQPRRAASSKNNNSSDTTVQAVQFQIPYKDGVLDIRPNQRVRVISCARNKVLETYEYVVSEVVDSSNPIEITFWANVDQEVSRGN